MKLLILYDSSETYNNAVFEHLSSFAKYSINEILYSHTDLLTKFDIDLEKFDAVCLHFSIRLPLDHISLSLSDSLEKYNGLKILFIQDEYDFALKTRFWIHKLGIRLVFTTVPEPNIQKIYPKEIFPNRRFVTNLTGYVPEELLIYKNVPPPSVRLLNVGYRGRSLPLKYGQLGFDKVNIGKIVKAYCDEYGISNDIAWNEEARIYAAELIKM